ncbi:hypothetical protein MPDQ_007681 [Monascus purpureus]|uniref:Acyltransferase 3 domain-containing protein n=1 Tax=Monascus purpureus TaxID=5098 RepID=A0A507QVX5_MONPU|nr:hypothetical protein MPDQ_007681 [Monascus purpureus]BDD55187.1 hypothetical protein MAP00_000734 [Monascus purpureus]
MDRWKPAVLLKPLRKEHPTVHEQQYLVGFRGLLVVQAFLWTFLQTFAPVTVYPTRNQYGPFPQMMVRKTLAVLFWNEYFIYAGFVILSARSLAIPFLRKPSGDVIARAVMCRSITLWFPVMIGLAIVKLAFNDRFFAVLDLFRSRTGNNTMPFPYKLPSTLAYWNSVYNVFWTTHDFTAQAGSTAFPTQTLWLLSVVYVQSYTVYMTMVIIPWTRAKWRVQGAFFFIITAWWCQSWAWFTISGLVLCDAVMNMDFKERSQRGIPLEIPVKSLRRPNGQPYRVPVWVPAVFCLTASLIMQYLWAAWRPQWFNAEFKYHSALYYTAGLNTEYMTHHTAARADSYLMVLGIFILLESYDVLQRFFQNPFLMYLGRRSLSFFLTQSTMMYIAGIRVFHHLAHDRGLSYSGTTVVTLIICLVLVPVTAEAFYRLVQRPSRAFSHLFYDFITS